MTTVAPREQRAGTRERLDGRRAGGPGDRRRLLRDHPELQIAAHDGPSDTADPEVDPAARPRDVRPPAVPVRPQPLLGRRRGHRTTGAEPTDRTSDPGE